MKWICASSRVSDHVGGWNPISRAVLWEVKVNHLVQTCVETEGGPKAQLEFHGSDIIRGNTYTTMLCNHGLVCTIISSLD
jgi:hypothetical protein